MFRGLFSQFKCPVKNHPTYQNYVNKFDRTFEGHQALKQDIVRVAEDATFAAHGIAAMLVAIGAASPLIYFANKKHAEQQAAARSLSNDETMTDPYAKKAGRP